MRPRRQKLPREKPISMVPSWISDLKKSYLRASPRMGTQKKSWFQDILDKVSVATFPEVARTSLITRS